MNNWNQDKGGIGISAAIPRNINNTPFIAGLRKGSWTHQSVTLTIFSMTLLSMTSQGTRLFSSPATMYL